MHQPPDLRRFIVVGEILRGGNLGLPRARMLAFRSLLAGFSV